MPFDGRDVVVTGGTGALGAAVVGALIAGGRHCHVPWLHEREAERFPYRDHKQVKLVGPVDLPTRQRSPAVMTAFRRSGRRSTSPAVLPCRLSPRPARRQLMQQIDINLVSCFLCCSAAVNAIGRTGQGGRIVNVASRPALEWRIGAGMAAYTASKAAVAALTVALSEEVAKEASSSTPWRRPSWIRRPIAPPCRKRTTISGRRSRRSRRPSCSSLRRRTR